MGLFPKLTGKVLEVKYASIKEYDNFHSCKSNDVPATTKNKAATKLRKKVNKKPQKKDNKKLKRKVKAPTVKAKKLYSSSYTSCAATHPPLNLGDGLKIWGGSCTRLEPCEVDYDIFIGLDSGMKRTYRQYPWNKGIEFLFRIQDMSVPQDVNEFNKLIEYIITELHNDKKVFCGCIGGHGRSGLVLSVLVKKMMGIDDAITYVRKNYCKKVVESQEQINWLYKHYGITKVKPSKQSYANNNTYTSWSKSSYTNGWSGHSEASPEVLRHLGCSGAIFNEKDITSL